MKIGRCFVSLMKSVSRKEMTVKLLKTIAKLLCLTEPVPVEEFRFNRDPDGRWYVDLPNWPGTRADLEMVAGADALLDLVGDGKPSVVLQASAEPIEGYEVLKHLGNGVYRTDFYEVPEIWLCAVTKFVFGHYPKEIYFKVL